MVESTTAANIALDSLHPLDREKVERFIARLEQDPILARNAPFLRPSQNIRVLPVSTEIRLLFDIHQEVIRILDVSTFRRLQTPHDQMAL